MKTKPSTLLKVMGILSIIGAVITILGAITMIAMGGVIGANFDAVANSATTSVNVTANGQVQNINGATAASIGMIGGFVFGIILLIVGAFWLILGIAAVTGKCGLCKGLSYFLIIIDILGIIGGIYLIATGQSTVSAILGSIFALIFPILILVGVKQTQQTAAPLQDLRTASK